MQAGLAQMLSALTVIQGHAWKPCPYQNYAQQDSCSFGQKRSTSALLSNRSVTYCISSGLTSQHECTMHVLSNSGSSHHIKDMCIVRQAVCKHRQSAVWTLRVWFQLFSDFALQCSLLCKLSKLNKLCHKVSQVVWQCCSFTDGGTSMLKTYHGYIWMQTIRS